MAAIRRKIEFVTRMGPAWVLWRASYALRKKSGLLKRRFPAVAFDEIQLAHLVRDGIPTTAEDYRKFRETGSARFFFPPGQLPDSTTLKRLISSPGVERTLAVADDYCRGRFLYYSRQVHDLGLPVNWMLNPFTGTEHHARIHWCDYATFSKKAGDIKDVWEPSRFACAFWLVRAYALTGDEKYPEAFWNLFESWCRQNPPNRGPNWKCGQETALRTMAWCFALYGFWNTSATTADRTAAIVRMLAIQADRIANNIGFAVSQKNNHALSEAVGLLTTAWLFPELKGAPRWHALGRRVLEREVRRQIYDDGSYVQQSMNYHRVMLHDCVWAIRLAELNGQPLSNGLKRRVASAGQFLFEMLDTESGGVPNYGPNDGALVLPLSPCDYTDYRATVQAARYQTIGQRVLDSGPWDETLVWLFGADALTSPRTAAVHVSRRLDAGGYYTLRSQRSWCMVRCHSYVDRPTHVDMLHVDLWHDGVNVLGDSGSYRYFVAEEPLLEGYFKDIQAHNTVEIDDTSPLKLFSRFCWLPWPKAKCIEHQPDCWQGEHYAYDRPPWHIVHRRSVRRVDDHTWVIHDELVGKGRHSVKLRWHLADGPFRLEAERKVLQLDLPCGPVTISVESPPGFQMKMHHGELQNGRVSGWTSNYYAEYATRPTLEVGGCSDFPVSLTTRIHLG